MGKSLLISLTLIFLTLLFQFKSIGKVLIVLAAFPLSLLGAMLGLFLTGNPMGFTAFIGIISLMGIVVRNGIILVDYADELIREHGYTLKAAAIASAKRRMRPIFLTSSAAAIGVVPMILSKSPLWSPLGSVLALGLVFSMVMTLFVVPVLYFWFIKPQTAQQEISQPDADERGVEARGFTGDAHVASQCECESAAGRGSADCRDERLRRTTHRDYQIAHPALRLDCVCDRVAEPGAAAILLLKIESGAKRTARTLHHDHARFGLSREPMQEVFELTDHLCAERVQIVRTIQGEPCHRAVMRNLNCLICHFALSRPAVAGIEDTTLKGLCPTLANHNSIWLVFAKP